MPILSPKPSTDGSLARRQTYNKFVNNANPKGHKKDPLLKVIDALPRLVRTYKQFDAGSDPRGISSRNDFKDSIEEQIHNINTLIMDFLILHNFECPYATSLEIEIDRLGKDIKDLNYSFNDKLLFPMRPREDWIVDFIKFIVHWRAWSEWFMTEGKLKPPQWFRPMVSDKKPTLTLEQMNIKQRRKELGIAPRQKGRHRYGS